MLVAAQDVVVTGDDTLGDRHVVHPPARMQDVLERVRVRSVTYIVQHGGGLHEFLLFCVEPDRISHLPTQM